MSLHDRYPDALSLMVFDPYTMREGKEQKQQYRLMERFRYVNDNYTITVPAGTVIDFASIPQWAQWFCDDDSPKILNPSVIHDYLYLVMGETGNLAFSREEVDKMFHDAMIKCNMGRFRAAVIYRMVRTFGGVVWDAHKQQ